VELDGSNPAPHGTFLRPKGLAVTNNVFQVNDPHIDKLVLVESEVRDDELRLTFRNDSKEEMKVYMRHQGGKVELIVLYTTPPSTTQGRNKPPSGYEIDRGLQAFGAWRLLWLFA